MSGSSPALPCASVGASAAHEAGGHSWRTVFTEPTRRNLGRETVGFLPECRRSALSSARATGCASHGALLFFAHAKKSKQKKARPCIRPCATRRVRSLPRRFRGRLTRAIQGPLSGDASVLSPHPCGSSPYATSPLSLLTGNRVLPASPRMDKRTPVRRSVGWKTAQHVPPPATSMFSPSHGVLLFKPVGKLRVIHPTDSTSLTPSPLWGPAYKGHPYRWRPRPFTPLAASMPLAPIRADSIRPSFASPVSPHSRKQAKRFASLASHPPGDSVPNPLQEAERRRCAGGREAGRRARSEGTGTSLRDGPRSNAGGRGVLRSKTRMQGWPSFWLLFLGHTRKSDAPCEAQPAVPAEESAAPDNAAYATIHHPPSKPEFYSRRSALCAALRRARLRSHPHPTNPTPLLPIGSGPPFCINPEAATPPSRGEHS